MVLGFFGGSSVAALLGCQRGEDNEKDPPDGPAARGRTARHRSCPAAKKTHCLAWSRHKETPDARPAKKPAKNRHKAGREGTAWVAGLRLADAAEDFVRDECRRPARLGAETCSGRDAGTGDAARRRPPPIQAWTWP